MRGGYVEAYRRAPRGSPEGPRRIRPGSCVVLWEYVEDLMRRLRGSEEDRVRTRGGAWDSTMRMFGDYHTGSRRTIG